MNYKIVEIIDQYTNEVTGTILKRFNDDGSVSCIPMDEANSDYQRYLNPEAEHSTPSVTHGE
jgi:hypothetical protein